MAEVLGAHGVDLQASGMEGSTLPALADEPERLVADGRYRIERFAGQGANKQVFLATDTELARSVAIAFFRLAAASPEMLVRVRREVRAMARLSDHPNIVTVYDIGDEGGRTYIVSRYVSGGSLADQLRVRGRPMAVPEVVSIGRQVADALTHAHDHGIVHRDLKPGNVFYTDGGVALLGDFGMAVAGSDARITSEFALVGTAPYMAPEQARGHPVDVRSDLYSLGAMLFELLCGRIPFTGEDPLAILAQAADADTPRPSAADANPAVPEALDTLIRKLMSARPADRPHAAAEVAAGLEAISPSASVRRAPRVVTEPVRLPPALVIGAEKAFVGRAGDLDALLETWRRVEEGQPRAVVVAGNAGIGKTRLCAQFASEVHPSGTVLYGRCEEEALVPYGPFFQCVRHFAPYRPWLPDQLDLPPGFELAWLGWPTPGAHPGRRRRAEGSERAVERFQLFESAVALVNAMAADVPLLVIFDDVHWADLPTLRMLRHMVRYVDSARVMLVLAMRDDEPDRDELRERALTELEREAPVETLALAGLTEDETAALVSARARLDAEPDVIERLRDRTGGNPFYIEETLRAVGDLAELRHDLAEPGLVRAGVPRGIESLIVRRLAPLPRTANDVLDAAAIIGREFGLGLLANVIGRPVPEVTDALEQSIREALVVEVPGYVDRFAFGHALVRVTLYRRQSASRRVALHVRCGEALEARYATSPGHAAELAHHFFEARRAGEAPRALRYARAAAEWAAVSLAYEDAVHQKERVLELLAMEGPDRDGERCDVLMSRGRALWRAGETKAAQDSFMQAAALARELDDAQRFADAALGFGQRFYDPGEVDARNIVLLEEALVRLDERDSGARARVLAGLADALHFRGSPERVQELTREAVEMARRVSDEPALIVALAARHTALLHIDFLDQRLEVNREMLELARTSRAPEHEAHALHWQIYDLFELGDLEAARRAHARLQELAEALRQPLYRHFSAAWAAKRAETDGRFDDAERHARESRHLAKRAQMPYADSNYAGQIFGLLRDQGRLDELPARARSYVGDRPKLVVWRAGMVGARLDAGQHERAREEFEELATDGFAGVPHDLFWLGAVCLLAEACGKLGDEARARTLYELLEPHAGRNAQIGLALSVGIVDRFLGRLAATFGDWPRAETHFDAALAESVRMGAVTSLAHIHCEYAEMLIARGDGPAREHLAAAQRTAERLGVQPVATRAAALEEELQADAR
ncbi:MAG TPA: protein kinase [Solirubrobacteraceae bacterium]|nr:protein kinase [Solirubrobacteraceae bacterium]